MATLTQNLEINIKANDNASSVLSGIRQKADDALGEKSGLAGLAGHAKGMLLGMGAALGGTAIVTGLAHMVTKTSEIGERLLAMSDRTGIATDKLSGLAFAAQQSGIDIGSLEQGFLRMNEAASAARDGSEKQKKAFEELGVKVQDSNGSLRAMDELFLDVSEGLKNVKDDSERAALAQDIFGKSGFNLLPFLRQGTAGIGALTKQAKELGLVMSQDVARQADEFGDTLDALKGAFDGVSQQVGVMLIPILTRVMKFATDAISALGGLIPVVASWATGLGQIIIDTAGIIFAPYEQAFLLVWENIKYYGAQGINAVVGTVTAGLNTMIEGVNSLGSAFGITISTIDWTPITVEAPKSFDERWEEAKAKNTARFEKIKATAASLGDVIEEEAGGMALSMESPTEALGSLDEATKGVAKTVREELRPDFAITTDELELFRDVTEKADAEVVALGETIDDFDISELAPPPNEFLTFAKNLGKSFTEPAGLQAVSTSLVSAFSDIANGGSFKEAMVQVGVAIGAAIGGPVGAAVAGFVARGLTSKSGAEKKREGVAGDVVAAVELGGIGLLDEDTKRLKGLKNVFEATPKHKRGDQIGKLAEEIRGELGGKISKKEADFIAYSVLTGKNHGEIGQEINRIIRNALVEEAKQEVISQEQAERRAAFREAITNEARAELGIDVTAAEGFSGVVRKPTVFLAGEAGPEHINISPMSGPYAGAYQGGAGGAHQFVFNISTLDTRSMEQWVRDNLLPLLGRFMRRESERGVALTYNTGILTQPTV